MIADRDVAFYLEQGYLVVPGVLGPAMVESLRRELDEILHGARHVTEHTDVYDLEPGHRPDAPRVRRVKVASCGARGTPPQFP
jgi:phytanoyl-CoA hydroxylase